MCVFSLENLALLNAGKNEGLMDVGPQLIT